MYIIANVSKDFIAYDIAAPYAALLMQTECPHLIPKSDDTFPPNDPLISNFTNVHGTIQVPRLPKSIIDGSESVVEKFELIPQSFPMRYLSYPKICHID